MPPKLKDETPNEFLSVPNDSNVTGGVLQSEEKEGYNWDKAREIEKKSPKIDDNIVEQMLQQRRT